MQHQTFPRTTLALALLGALGLPVAHAATYTVTTLDDSGPGSLREAVLKANATSTIADTIVFDPTLPEGVITLTSGVIVITDRLTINGPGENALTVSGNKGSKIFNVNSGKATIQGLTLKDGNGCGGSTENGGAIANAGLLTLNHLVLSNNYNQCGGHGGAIFNSGSLTATYLTLSGNTTGGVGGAIYNTGTLNLSNGTVAGNQSDDSGGGIFNERTITMRNSTLSANLTHSSGGGIFNTSGAMLTVSNSTLSENTAIGNGGAIFNAFSNDDPNNIQSGTVTLGNSIVSGNTAPLGKEIFAGKTGFTGESGFTSQGSNLFGENNVSGVVGVTLLDTDITLPGAVETAIAPMDENGGPTPTYMLVDGSPAIDAGDNALVPTDVIYDQRGVGFPRILGGTVDIGAVEGSGTPSPTYPLAVTKPAGNTGTGTVTSAPAGITCGTTCDFDFPENARVILTAKADAGSSFGGWGGDCVSTALTCAVTMNAAKDVTALFVTAPKYLLTISNTSIGTGTGIVTSLPSGINCGSDCTESYDSGVTVTLTAVPTAGSTFTAWTGCTVVPTNPKQCKVVMTAARTVKATFSKSQQNLTVRKVGNSATTALVASIPTGILCGTDCTEPYAFNSKVYLVAIPATGTTFVGWTNCTAVSVVPGNQVCVVTMDKVQTVIATFR